MARFILLCIAIVGVLSAASYAVSKNGNYYALPLEPQPVVTPDRIGGRSNEFLQAGTLVFYPNNVGVVPYLFYSSAYGNTLAKALVFPRGYPANFLSWTGAQITVSGYLTDEHVVVRTITYESGP